MRARAWLLAAATLVGIATTGALGAWQLGRAHQKEALAAAIASQRGLPPMAQQELLAAAQPQDLLHRPVRLRGTWDAPRTVYLDNRQMGGRVGFFVLTPLLLEGSDRAVLVQRGWAPRNFTDREALAPVETPAGPVELAGRIAPAPAKLYQFAAAGSGAIRQNLDLPAYAAETGLALLPVSVQQTGAPSQGLLRDWPEGGASGPEKNYGYAVQWWALSALITFLYVWFQFIHPRRQASQR